MATGRKIHATTTSNPALKNSKPPGKFHFSTAKLMVATAVLNVAVAGVIALYGCPQDVENSREPQRKPAAPLTDSFTVTKPEKISIHNSLKSLPPGTSKSLALVVDAGKKLLEADSRVSPGKGYSPMIDDFIESYAHAGGKMIDSAIAESEKLPEPERESFLDEAHLAVTALLLRPFAAWEGPAVLKELDRLISSPGFSQDSLDRFVGDNNLVREYFELTLNVGNRFSF
jgi:hypothetical protein